MLCSACHTQNLLTSVVCSACGTLLEDGAPPPTHALPAGTMLQGGAFVIEAVLGQGGFGITYAGRDTRLQRPVAIKEFFPTGCSRRGHTVHPARATDYEAARAGFLEEARRLARFDHVGIVDVYGAFAENNTAYMVMEHLRGKTLAQMLSEQNAALPERTALDLIERAAQALAQVHAAGLLHHDIKPDNIMVCDGLAPAARRVVLIDFGTARNLDLGQSRSHSIVLTPGYAPLEQYAGRARRGAYSDIYSLAATLYHLLTGEAPPAASDRAMGLELPRLRQLQSKVSPGVLQAVERGLQTEIARRPQSVAEFLHLLHGAAATVPHSAAPPRFEPAPLPLSPRAVARRRALSWMSTAAVFVLGLAAWRHSAPPPAPPPVPDPGMTFRPPRRVATPPNWAGMAPVLGGPHLVLPSDADIGALAFSPDGRTIAASMQIKPDFKDVGKPVTIYLCDARSGGVQRILSGSLGNVTALAFSPDGALLAGGIENPFGRRSLSTRFNESEVAFECNVWSVGSGKLKWAQFKTPRLNGARPQAWSWVKTLAFSPDGRTLATGMANRTVMLWNMKTHALRRILLGTSTNMSANINSQDARPSFSISPDGATLAFADRFSVKLWDMSSGQLKRKLKGIAVGLAFSPDGALLAGAHENKAVLWETRSGRRRVLPVVKVSDEVEGVAFSPDGRKLAVAGKSQVVQLLDAKNGALLAAAPSRMWSAGALHFTSDGKNLLSVSHRNGILSRWQLR